MTQRAMLRAVHMHLYVAFKHMPCIRSLAAQCQRAWTARLSTHRETHMISQNSQASWASRVALLFRRSAHSCPTIRILKTIAIARNGSIGKATRMRKSPLAHHQGIFHAKSATVIYVVCCSAPVIESDAHEPSPNIEPAATRVKR
jgi:hypothetical protein